MISFNPSSIASRVGSVAAAAFCAMQLTPLAAHGAEVYRWAGSEGRVHYGDKPPRNAAQLRRLPEDGATLSVVPVAPAVKNSAELARAASSAGARTVLVPREEPPLAAGPTLYEDWRERCEAERRVDCSNPTAATYDTVRSYSERTPYWPGLAP